MLQFILDNSIPLLFCLFILINLMQFIMEYFPIKPRYSETYMQKYMEYNLYKRYEHDTRKYLPGNKLYEFRFGEREDTEQIQRGRLSSSSIVPES